MTLENEVLHLEWLRGRLSGYNFVLTYADDKTKELVSDAKDLLMQEIDDQQKKVIKLKSNQ